MKLWIARDKSGSLYLYEDKPEKKGDEFIGKSWAWIFTSLFPEVTFENSPQKVEFKL